MNCYMLGIRHYFSGIYKFYVEAENREDALKEGRNNPKLSDGNYDMSTLYVVKKCKK